MALKPEESPSIVDLKICECFGDIIAQKNMQLVGEALRRIVAADGLGVAILVAWQHGLESGHIPLERDAGGRPKDEQARQLHDPRFHFVHVPVRKFRLDKAKLVQMGIMNKEADPVWFFCHEDGLVGTFSFSVDQIKKDTGLDLDQADITDILKVLAKQGFIIPANVNNRQVQFKDPVAKKLALSRNLTKPPCLLGFAGWRVRSGPPAVFPQG